jgi:protein-disulfide isomerase
MFFSAQIFKLIGITTLAILFSSSLLLAQIGGERRIIAKVQGKNIRLKDVEDKKINDLRKQLYQALTEKIKLLALKKLSATNKNFKKQADFKISDKEVKLFYNLNQSSIGRSFEESAPRIKKYMQAQKKSEYTEVQYRLALKKGLVKSLLVQPHDLLLKIPLETAYIFGKKIAPVVLLEFSDYQCPFCSRIQPTLKELKAKYKNRVSFGYRHLPLPFHTEADEAAIAVECARDQGKFEPYHQVLFQNSRQQHNKDLNQYAKQVGVADQAKFKKCLSSEKYRTRVNHDIEVASNFGMNGTPSFAIGRYNTKGKFILGSVLSGALPKEAFISTIEKYLKKKRN